MWFGTCICCWLLEKSILIKVAVHEANRILPWGVSPTDHKYSKPLSFLENKMRGKLMANWCSDVYRIRSAFRWRFVSDLLFETSWEKIIPRVLNDEIISRVCFAIICFTSWFFVHKAQIFVSYKCQKLLIYPGWWFYDHVSRWEPTSLVMFFSIYFNVAWLSWRDCSQMINIHSKSTSHLLSFFRKKNIIFKFPAEFVII